MFKILLFNLLFTHTGLAGLVIEAIGYKIDHVQNRVGISDKNVKKAF